MKKHRQTKKRHKTGRKIYGQSTHYWPEIMLPFPVAAACIQVVLDRSEKARAIYNEAVEAWNRPDCQKALSEVRIPFSSCLEAIVALDSKDVEGWEDPFDELKERYRNSGDFKILIERINQFILKEKIPEYDFELMSIEDLECLLSWAPYESPVDFLRAKRKHPEWKDMDVRQLVEIKMKEKGITNLRNPFLDKVFNRFWQQTVPELSQKPEKQ